MKLKKKSREKKISILNKAPNPRQQTYKSLLDHQEKSSFLKFKINKVKAF